MENSDPNSFYVDVINWLSGEKSGHLSKYAFTTPTKRNHNKGTPNKDHKNPPRENDVWKMAQGPDLWEKFVREVGDIYTYGRETKSLEKHGLDISSSLPDTISLVELGPGDERAVKNKTVKLSKLFNKVAANNRAGNKQIVEYVGYDINEEFARESSEIMRKELHVKARPIVGDFTTSNDRIQTESTPVMIVFGGTLFNAPTIRGVKSSNIIQGYLENLRDMVGPDGHVIITQDTGKDKASFKAYEHEACKETCLSILHRMNVELDIQGFDSKKFGYSVTWNPADYLLTMNAVYEGDDKKNVKLGKFERSFKPGKNGNGEADTLPLVNVFKFPASKFQEIAENAGFEIVETYENKDDSVATHHLKVKPSGL